MARISFATSQNSSTNEYYDRPAYFPYTSANPGTSISYAPYMSAAQYGAYISSKFNGFPFPVFEKDIEGNPFVDWDKKTMLNNNSYGPPSKKTNIYIPVLGIPEYSYSFTREQLIEAYWRALGSALVVNDTNDLSGSFKYRQGINLLKTSEDQLKPQDLSNPQIKGISTEEWEAENPPFCYDFGFGEQCFQSGSGPESLEGKEVDLSNRNKGFFSLTLKTGKDFASSAEVGAVGINFSHAVLKVGENDYRPYVFCNICSQQYPSFISTYKYAATGIGCCIKDSTGKCKEMQIPGPYWYNSADGWWKHEAFDGDFGDFGRQFRFAWDGHQSVDLPDGIPYVYEEGKSAEADSAIISAYEKGRGFYSKLETSDSMGGSCNASITVTYKSDTGNVTTLTCGDSCLFQNALKAGEKTQNLGTSPCLSVEDEAQSSKGSPPCEISCYGGIYGGEPQLVDAGSSGTIKLALNNVSYCCQDAAIEQCCDEDADFSKINLWSSTTWSDYVTYNSLSDDFLQAYKSSSYGSSYGPYMIQSVFNSCNIAGYGRGFGLSASITKEWYNERAALTNGQLVPLSPKGTTYQYEITPKIKSKLLVNGPVENCYVKVWVALIKTVENFSSAGFEKNTSIESITPYEINPSPTNNRGCSAVTMDDTDCLTLTSGTDQSNLFADAGVEFELDPSTFDIADFSNSLTDKAPPGSNYGIGDIASCTVSKEYRIIKYSLDPDWEPPHRLIACNYPVGPYKGNWQYKIFPADSAPEQYRINALSKPVSQSHIDEFNAYVDDYEADFCGKFF